MRKLPKRLKKGDTVGIIAPSSPPNQENLQKALPFLEELGLKIKLGKSVDAAHGYLAGTDDERLADLHAMFEDPEVSGIICAGGGYGAARYADRIDYAMIMENPKVFWGYSDITFLHTAIGEYAEMVTFHGPMLASDVGKPEFHERSGRMFGQLFEPFELHYTEEVAPLETIVGGIAQGELVGGNLSLIRSAVGTKFDLDVKGKILLIEDIDEEPYEVDEILNQLRLARKFEEAAGIVIGDFKNASPKKRKPSLTLDQVFNDYFGDLKIPVVKGFKIGHCEPHFSVPLGALARLDGDAKTLTILPGVE
ncbi:LD-carboxypeptidase [Microbacterium sp. APC 3898]|uniref:LD-carboxypeptidase n=2 Tax=Planococcus TaxID=1372 RepID=A0ABT7ZP87_9BACL|nr:MULTISPECIES: LD-carboxypeptidase [Terrabacteria group]MBD8013321.1 LD-carboxypeptidase [Planococcus wigleyi]MBF6632552.1 LD-carboxypeptidase [Planococcus sp. (in: firmicutes)]MDN3428973.1 LD-carboxypeptidase [Planococcus sp. APC 4016]MDN3501074.1 LD-carboxypeptidase [Microbacterium sp. APC 3898]